VVSHKPQLCGVLHIRNGADSGLTTGVKMLSVVFWPRSALRVRPAEGVYVVTAFRCVTYGRRGLVTGEDREHRMSLETKMH